MAAEVIDQLRPSDQLRRITVVREASAVAAVASMAVAVVAASMVAVAEARMAVVEEEGAGGNRPL